MKRNATLCTIEQHADRWGRPSLPTPPAGAQLRARFRSGITQQVILMRGLPLKYSEPNLNP